MFPDGHGGDHHSSGHPWHSGAWMQRRTACSPRHCSLGFEGCGALDVPRFHSHFADSAAAALVTTLTQPHGSDHSGLHLPLFRLLKGGSYQFAKPFVREMNSLPCASKTRSPKGHVSLSGLRGHERSHPPSSVASSSFLLPVGSEPAGGREMTCAPQTREPRQAGLDEGRGTRPGGTPEP